MPAGDRIETEWQTRKRRVDTRLVEVGWPVVPCRDETPVSSYGTAAVTEFLTANGPADYALASNGQILGIVEAKRLTVGPAGVLTQAERYARGVSDSPFDFRGCRVPFLYSTNGEVLYFHDARDSLNLSRKVRRFHTP